MTILKGHFDGKQVVLDEPFPPSVTGPVRVRILIDDGTARGVLDEIARLARPAGLPRDYSQQHEHYVKGAPRR